MKRTKIAILITLAMLLFIVAGCKESHRRVRVTVVTHGHYGHNCGHHCSHFRPMIIHHRSSPVIIYHKSPPIIIHHKPTMHKPNMMNRRSSSNRGRGPSSGRGSSPGRGHR